MHIFNDISDTSLTYLPYPKLTITWKEDFSKFNFLLPWLVMDIEVNDIEKEWIQDAIDHLHRDPVRENCQKLLKFFKEYPCFYYKPRPLASFKYKNRSFSSLTIDLSTPQQFIKTMGMPFDPELEKYLPKQWGWDWSQICEAALIKGTSLYDPISFVSYLICYRLDWESNTWSGQDGLGALLKKLLKKNEEKFFLAIGWISCQSWLITSESCKVLKKALTTFPEATHVIKDFIQDEVGHHKFMEQVFVTLGLNKEDFNFGASTKWLLDIFFHMASVSLLSFSAMVNLFEAAYYEGDDPISRVLKLSSKPQAAKGYDLHYKINQEHRHCDMPVLLSLCLAPQPIDHLYLTLAVFELTLAFLDGMEKDLESYL